MCGGAFAGSVTIPVAAAPRVKSVVRADAQGRLIRAVVVSPHAGQFAARPEIVGTPSKARRSRSWWRRRQSVMMSIRCLYIP